MKQGDIEKLKSLIRNKEPSYITTPTRVLVAIYNTELKVWYFEPSSYSPYYEYLLQTHLLDRILYFINTPKVTFNTIPKDWVDLIQLPKALSFYQTI